MLLLSLTAQAYSPILTNPQTINFKKQTNITLPANDQYQFFRVNEHQQITYIKIHDLSVSYFYDTYNAFPYYDTLIPPHTEPLEISIHTFLHNDNPNKITAELRTIDTPSSASLKGHKDLKAGFTAIMLNYLKESKNNKWIHLFKAALKTFETDNNHLWAGIAANHLAGEYQDLSQYTKSTEVYTKAINHFIKAKAPAYRWHSEGRLGLAEWRLNQIEQAQKRFEQVANHGEQLGLSKLVKTAYNNIGLMHWAKRDIHAAISTYKKSLSLSDITEAQILNQDIKDFSFGHISQINNLALAYHNLGQTNKALKIYKTKIKAAQFLKDPNGLFSGYINMANLLSSETLIDQALSNLNLAHKLEIDKTDSLSNWWKNQLQIQYGRVYQSLGLNNLALNHFQKALSQTNAENFKRQRIDVLLALAQIQNVQPKQKKQWLAEAETLLSDAKLKTFDAKVLEIKARYASEENNHPKAIDLFTLAKNTLKDQHKIIQSTQIDMQIAEVYQTQGKHQLAVKTIQNSLAILPQSMDRLLANKLNNALAFNHWKAGDKPIALKVIQQSVDALNGLIPHITHSKTQQQLKQHVDETLTLYSMLFAKEQDPAKTIAFIHKTQQAWQSQKSNTSPKIKNNTNSRNLNRASELFNQIGNISFALENNRLSDETRDTLEREIISLNNELDYLSTINKSETPKIDIAAMQSAMNPDELTIQFMTGQYGSIAWWISKDKIICVPLENREKLATWVEHTRQTIADKAKLNKAIIELTEHLFTPLADYPEVDKINLILDDPLNVLPIAALPLPETNEPMIDKYTIRSFNQLAFNLTNKTIGTEKTIKAWQAAYFANPVHHSKDTRLPTDVSPNEITEFAPLAGTAYEVKGINALIPGQVFQGFEANKNNFALKTKPSQNAKTSILHMATHAFFNEDHPDLSALVLSAYDEKGKTQASMVRASEIRNMDMPHELVVLSGCETGLSSGNGLTGLTQSFLQAGTKSIVSSLWQVDDRATSTMMTLLYQNLNEGQSIETALRNAQIHIKNQHQTRHPKYWAGWFHISQQ